jgi:transposase
LIPPAYVKPFVKRQKNDAADAEAIADALNRPTMRFVAVKTEEQQARAMHGRLSEKVAGLGKAIACEAKRGGPTTAMALPPDL